MTNKSYQRHRSYCRLFCYRSQGCDDGKMWYLFYEVGTERKESGQSDGNKLYKENNGLYQGSPAYNSKKKYALTQVRKNKTK